MCRRRIAGRCKALGIIFVLQRRAYADTPCLSRSGGIEVAVLDQQATIDPIKSFSVSDSVAKFTAAAYSKNPRVKYSTFVSQKKGGPAKQFTVKA